MINIYGLLWGRHQKLSPSQKSEEDRILMRFLQKPSKGFRIKREKDDNMNRNRIDE